MNQEWLINNKLFQANIRVEMTDSTSGEIVSWIDVGLFCQEDGQFQDYIWREGNYACDCNRGDFFSRAKGEDDMDLPCGDGRFFVRITDVNGGIIYRDGRD